MTRPFTKPPTTHQEQVELLIQRGMRIDDAKAAEFYLGHLNYYRLAAYWLPFESRHSGHRFKPATSFSKVLNLMDSIAPAHHWRKRLKALIKEHAIPTEAMGFPDDWFTRQIWQER